MRRDYYRGSQDSLAIRGLIFYIFLLFSTIFHLYVELLFKFSYGLTLSWI